MKFILSQHRNLITLMFLFFAEFSFAQTISVSGNLTCGGGAPVTLSISWPNGQNTSNSTVNWYSSATGNSVGSGETFAVSIAGSYYAGITTITGYETITYDCSYQNSYYDGCCYTYSCGTWGNSTCCSGCYQYYWVYQTCSYQNPVGYTTFIPAVDVSYFQETCNGLDDNCDTQIDEGVQNNYYVDTDGDGYGAGTATAACTAPIGFVTTNTDCNNTNTAVNPTATEICNSIDDDCDTQIDEDLTFIDYYADADGDGYGAGNANSACAQPLGFVTANTDCNDSNSSVNPVAAEFCNSIDDDCDTQIDEAVQNSYYVDTDGDGYGAGTATLNCTAPAGYVIDNTDCDDTNAAINAAATEVCNSIDDDCDTQTDDGLTFTDYYADADGDGYGAGTATNACALPTGYLTTNTDCNNNDAAIYPGATEVCNSIDDDCDTQIDNGLVFFSYYEDADADGYGADAATSACAQPTGFVLNNTDCNNALATVNPVAIEICGNSIDDNCNGISEEGCLNPGENPANATSITPSTWPACSEISGTLVGSSASSSAQTICLTGEDKWHQFVATSEGVSIVVNSTTANIVIELQTAAGVLVAEENAVSGPGGEVLNHYGLTAGQVYKVGVRNYNSVQGNGTYSICAKMLKRGSCDYGPGPYTLCQYFKATWAGATGTSYTYTFTGISGPASGNVYTRTQNSDICVLSAVLPTLPYGSTYNVLITNTYTINDGAGVAETISVPALSTCMMNIATQPITALRASDRCAAGPRFRGAIVASLPWVCGATNWRWEFTELDTQGQPVGLPISVNRGAASNYINLGTVLQLQYGKTYSVRTAPILPYTGSDYQWGTTTCMSLVGTAGMIADGSQANQQVVRTEKANEVNMILYPNPTHGTDVNINLSGVTSDNVQVRLVDAMGRQVWSNRYSVDGILNTNITFERPLANGLYFVEAIYNGELQTQRMMVQR